MEFAHNNLVVPVKWKVQISPAVRALLGTFDEKKDKPKQTL